MTGSDSEYLIWFDAGKCIQCHGCETACKSWRGLGYGVQYRRVLNVWQGYYPLITSSSLSLSCLHCAEPACAAACPEEAIAKNGENGLVTVDEGLCTGCGLCEEACAYGVPQITEDKVMRKCDLCREQQTVHDKPPCVDTCPGRALTIRKVSRSEKMLHEDQIIKQLQK